MNRKRTALQPFLFGLAFSLIVVTSLEAVPDIVEEAFSKLYPDAEDVSWEVDSNGSWEAQFQMGKAKRRADFHESGEWIETEESIEFKELPDEVQKAVREAHGGDEIKEVEKVDSAAKGLFYDVELEREGKNRDVEYTPDGKVLQDIGSTIETATDVLFEPIPELNTELKKPSEIGRLELLLEFAFNLLVILIYAYVLYYRRHHDHKMLFLLLGFNLFLFPIFLLNSVLTAGVGFTIFALLALVRLRSDTFDKTEVAYLLGAVALTFINSVLPAKVEYMASIMVLATTYFGDHPRLWRDAYQAVEIRLPLKEMNQMLNAEYLFGRVEEEFDVEVNDIEIMRVEKKRVRLKVMYREKLGEQSGRKRLPIHGVPASKVRSKKLS